MSTRPSVKPVASSRQGGPARSPILVVFAIALLLVPALPPQGIGTASAGHEDRGGYEEIYDDDQEEDTDTDGDNAQEGDTDGDDGQDAEQDDFATNPDECENCVAASESASDEWHPFRKNVFRMVEGTEIVALGDTGSDTPTLVKTVQDAGEHTAPDDPTAPDERRAVETVLDEKIDSRPIHDSAAADYDGDGREEIAILTGFPLHGFGLTVVDEDGQEKKDTIRPGAIGHGAELVAADLDGDGPPEFVVVSLAQSGLSLTRMVHALGVDPDTGDVGWRTIGTLDPPIHSHVAAGRVDASGADRLLVTGASSPEAEGHLRIVGLDDQGELTTFAQVVPENQDLERKVTADVNRTGCENAAAVSCTTHERTRKVGGRIDLVPMAVDSDGNGLDEIVLFEEWRWKSDYGPSPNDDDEGNLWKWANPDEIHTRHRFYVYGDAADGWDEENTEHLHGPEWSPCEQLWADRAVAGDLDKDGREEFACMNDSGITSVFDDKTMKFDFFDYRQIPSGTGLMIADLDHDASTPDQLIVLKEPMIKSYTYQPADEGQGEWMESTYAEVGEIGHGPYLLAADVDGDGTVVEWTGEHELLIADPKPLAVFAPPPIVAGSGQTPGTTAMTLSDRTCNEQTDMKFLDIDLGLGGAYESPMGSFEFEALFKATSRTEWSSTQGICTDSARTWTSSSRNHTVLFEQTPVDVYHYKILSSPEPDRVGDDLAYALWGNPGTWLWNIEDYNQAVKRYNSPELREALGTDQNDEEPELPTDVFLPKGDDGEPPTFGDPGTYPDPGTRGAIMSEAKESHGQTEEVTTRDADKFHDDVQARLEILSQSAGGFTWKSQVIDLTTASGSGSVSISRQESASDSLSWSLGTGFSTSLRAGGFKASLAIHAGGGQGYTVETSESRTFTATVPSITDLDTFKDHRYKWGLFVYPRTLDGNDVSVVNYWVQDYQGDGPIDWVEAAPFPTHPASASTAGPDLTLRWDPAASVESYQVEVVDTDPTRLDPVMIRTTVADTELPIDGKLEVNRVYEWRVRGLNDEGEGPWSPATRFAVVDAPQEAPRILTAEPAGTAPARPVDHALADTRGPPVTLFSADALESTDTTEVPDLSGNGNGGVFAGANGSIPIVSGTAGQPDRFRFDGVDDQIHTNTSIPDPGPQEFTVSAWINTTTPGGKIVGYESTRNGTSGQYDRHLYLDDEGHVLFGMWDPAHNDPVTVRSPEPVTDGAWHHVAGSYDGKLLRLFVDGVDVQRDQRAGASCDAELAATEGVCRTPFTAETPEAYQGWWRVGGGQLRFWPGFSGTTNFTGQVAHVMVHDRALRGSEVAPMAPVYAPPATDVALLWSEVEGYGYQDLGGAEDYVIRLEPRTDDEEPRDLHSGQATDASGTPTTWEGPVDSGLWTVHVAALNGAGIGPWSQPRDVAVPLPPGSTPAIASQEAAAGSGGETSPSGGEADPSGDETSPSGDDTSPPGDDTAPSGDETGPSGDDTSPSGDDTTPSGDDTSPEDRDGPTDEIEWTPVTGAQGYELQVADSAAFNGTLLYQDQTENTSWTPTSLEPGEHYVRVRALEEGGPGAWSEPVRIAVQSEEQADTDTATGGGGGAWLPLALVALAGLGAAGWYWREPLGKQLQSLRGQEE